MEPPLLNTFKSLHTPIMTLSPHPGPQLCWTTLEWWQYGKPTSVGIVTGMVAGLAAVTPASGYIGPIGGVLLGMISGVVCEQVAHLVKVSQPTRHLEAWW